jgi:hypothetical protein
MLPTSDEQIRFLVQIQRLLDEGCSWRRTSSRCCSRWRTSRSKFAALDIDPGADVPLQIVGKFIGGLREAIPVRFVRAARWRVIVLGLPCLEPLNQFVWQREVHVIHHAARPPRSGIRRRPDSAAAPLGPDAQETVVLREEMLLHG